MLMTKVTKVKVQAIKLGSRVFSAGVKHTTYNRDRTVRKKWVVYRRLELGAQKSGVPWDVPALQS